MCNEPKRKIRKKDTREKFPQGNEEKREMSHFCRRGRSELP